MLLVLRNELKIYRTVNRPLLILLSLGVGAGIANGVDFGTPRPNIILIMVDDMEWSNIGCYGGMIETPNLDILSENGVRFNQFYNVSGSG